MQVFGKLLNRPVEITDLGHTDAKNIQLNDENKIQSSVHNLAMFIVNNTTPQDMASSNAQMRDTELLTNDKSAATAIELLRTKGVTFKYV
jgi:hypothetical protein